jgi:GDPmannose 4,6-dehydratase
VRALISGCTGQDGAYLAQFLLNKGYEVFGLKRRASTDSQERLRALGIEDKVKVLYGDMTDEPSLRAAVRTSNPDEVYNLAATVTHLFDTPIATFEVNAVGVMYLLDILKGTDIRFFQASTSELFGGKQPNIQNEETPFTPRSPYGISKAAAHFACINYRESYGVKASCGILYNHESPLRGDDYVTKKISMAARAISYGKQHKLYLGDLEAKRDWGHARDYVEAMWLSLQRPDDYIIATGKLHSVRDVAIRAFEAVGLNYKDFVEIDKKLTRKPEKYVLCGDPTKIKQLGWEAKTTFQQLIDEMVFDRLKAVA